MTGYIKEVFTSIQGEGIRIGTRQTFIRFLGCNLSCNYCDTPESQKMADPFIFGNNVFKNPIAVNFLLGKIIEDEVTLTGGEPLLQIDFLKGLAEQLKNINKKIYLDTNGTLPKALGQIVEYVDWFALDFKIPTATGRPALWEEHEDCLKTAVQKEVFVKMVINENLLPGELDKVCSIIESINKDIPLVIQPVFSCNISNILDIQKKALAHLKDVRIIPQIHKYLNLK